MKRLIAMKATPEEVETLGIELDSPNNVDFKGYDYICNNTPSKFSMHSKLTMRSDREIHETFNKDIFLEACGLLPKVPTLEEVKEYFKDAEVVKSLYEEIFKEVEKIHYEMGAFFCKDDKNIHRKIWSKEHGYAKIISYKQPLLQITKETEIRYNMKKEFPELFVPEYTKKQAEEKFNIKII